MGILNEVTNGGGPPIMKFDGRAGVYKVRDKEETFNNQEFVAHILEARGGRIKFDRYGGPPDRRLGSVFPEDETPSRSSLGDTDESKWPKGKFGDEPEDP